MGERRTAGGRRCVENARELRRRMTPAERALWRALRNRRLAESKLRRPHRVGAYVLDSCCLAVRLGIEVDGGVHDDQAERDEARTQALKMDGYSTLRVRNEDVLNDIDAVLDRILDAIRHLQVRNDLRPI